MWHLLKDMRKKDKGLAFLAVLLIAGQVFLDLKLPDYTKEITVLISSESNTISDYLLSGGKMLACALGSALLAVIVGYLAAKIAADFSHNVRGKVFHKVFDFGAGEISKFSTSSLITRTTNDITQIQMFVAMGMQTMIKAPVMAVWAVIKIVNKSWTLSVITAGFVVALLALMLIVVLVILPRVKRVQKLTDNINLISRENLTGISVVHAYNAEEYQEDKFETANDVLMRTQLFNQRAMALLMPAVGLAMNALSLTIYWVGAAIVNRVPAVDLAGRISTFGDIVVFGTYATYIIMSLMMLVMILVLLPMAQVSAVRINEVLDAPISLHEGKTTEAPEQGTVEFRDVSFRYPSSSGDVLEHVSFRANKGETVAFIGATGSGKTTLVSLAARFYDATEGQVLIDGQDVRSYSFDALYDRIGYVTQRAIVFAGDVRSNVLFGESSAPQDDESVQRALSLAQATEFVDKLPGKLDAPIAQAGANVSGGQKQRLSIARALARKPEILIFDDSFSALDYRTDASLRAGLARELSDTTCLIVAQRIGTIRHADRIVVLDEGRVAGIGTHDELMKNCSVYREIAMSQLSAAELEKEGV